MKEKARKKGRREMNGYGIETYADLAKTVGGMVLANEMAHRPLEFVSGDFAPWDEIFQWYIISYPDFLMEHTDEPVFHDEELDLYVWGTAIFYSPRYLSSSRTRSVASAVCCIFGVTPRCLTVRAASLSRASSAAFRRFSASHMLPRDS